VRLRFSETIAIAYFLYLAGLAPFARIPVARRTRVLLTGALLAVAAAWLSRFDGGWLWQARNIAPLVYLLAAYRMPALLVGAYSPAFERRLAEFDRRWLGGREGAFAERAPRGVLEGLELAYLFCYPLVPAGWLCLHFLGGAAQEERYWAAVLLAAALCYGALPWLPTRPPRAIERPLASRSGVRQLNLFVLDRASVQLNTFPSGHVAIATAAALAVAVALPVAGGLLGFVALGITIASVVGRYHYAADALAGAIVGLTAFVVSQLA
jgi:membrane-associated phospholipid phosphatase